MTLDHETRIPAERLLERFAQGDQAAARVLSDDLLPGVLRHAWRMLGDRGEAEDVAQEAMLRLWRQAPRWESQETKISTWLYRVTHNLCIDHLRKRRPVTGIENAPEPSDPTPGVLEVLLQRDEHKILLAAMARLPARQREALELRYFEECPNPEIAQRMACSVEAVESLLARARRFLAAHLGGQSQESDVA